MLNYLIYILFTGKELTLYYRNVYMESDVGFASEEIDIKKGTVFQY